MRLKTALVLSVLVAGTCLTADTVVNRQTTKTVPKYDIIESGKVVDGIAARFDRIAEYATMRTYQRTVKYAVAIQTQKEEVLKAIGYAIRATNKQLASSARTQSIQPRGPPRSTQELTSSSQVRSGSVWDALAACESGGNWGSTVGSFEGGLQFSNQTWLAYGGGQFASHAYLASREQQIQIAEKIQVGQGWGAWPVCSRKVGLR